MLTAWIYNIILVVIHLYFNRIVKFRNIPRSIWLSLAGGASMAYVFLHLLPEFNRYQVNFIKGEKMYSWWSEHLVYLLALAGVIIFYGFERLVKLQKETEDHNTKVQVFYLHMSTYFVYNFVIGYLLISELRNWSEMTFFFLAMAFHFIVNDFGLIRDHQLKYRHEGRWLLSFAVLAGGVVASFFIIPENVVLVLFGLIGGSVILNVLKEELPEERKSKFWAFLSGAIAYGSILLLMETR